jgi:hypothetical protein
MKLLLLFLSTDPIVRFFSLKYQRIFTKLSFAIYLTQFPIFFYNVGKVRNAEYFEFIKIMVSNKKLLFCVHVYHMYLFVCVFVHVQYNVEEFSTILISSIVLHLLIEAPFNNIRKIIFDKKMVTTNKKVD